MDQNSVYAPKFEQSSRSSRLDRKRGGSGGKEAMCALEPGRDVLS
jgi:hypothetical protein